MRIQWIERYVVCTSSSASIRQEVAAAIVAMASIHVHLVQVLMVVGMAAIGVDGLPSNRGLGGSGLLLTNSNFLPFVFHDLGACTGSTGPNHW